MNTLFNKKNLPVVILNVSTILVVAIMLFVSQVVAKTDQSVAAQSLNPGLLSYQGTILDMAGTPLNGIFDIVFRLYDSQASTVPMWEEIRIGVNAVPVKNGFFTVMLGSLTPLPITVWEAPELYLGVRIGNDNEMSPREKLTVVPWAATANVAQLALSVPGDSITGANIIDGSLTQADAPSLVRGARQGEIIQSGQPVFDSGSNENGEIVVSYPCFPNDIWAFVAANGHYEANQSTVVGSQVPGLCETTIIVSPPTNTPIRIQWIAVGN